MNKYGFAVTLLVFIGLAFYFQVKRADEKNKEKAYESIMKTCNNNFSLLAEMQQSSDVSSIAEAYTSFHTDDIVLMMPDQSPIVGREAVYSFAKEFFEQYTIEFPSWTSDEMETVGKWAYHRFSGIVIISPKDGSESRKKGFKALDILRKQSNRAWKVARRIYNLN